MAADAKSVVSALLRERCPWPWLQGSPGPNGAVLTVTRVSISRCSRNTGMCVHFPQNPATDFELLGLEGAMVAWKAAAEGKPHSSQKMTLGDQPAAVFGHREWVSAPHSGSVPPQGRSLGSSTCLEIRFVTPGGFTLCSRPQILIPNADF